MPTSDLLGYLYTTQLTDEYVWLYPFLMDPVPTVAQGIISQHGPMEGSTASAAATTQGLVPPPESPLTPAQSQEALQAQIAWLQNYYSQQAFQSPSLNGSLGTPLMSPSPLDVDLDSLLPPTPSSSNMATK